MPEDFVRESQVHNGASFEVPGPPSRQPQIGLSDREPAPVHFGDYKCLEDLHLVSDSPGSREHLTI